MQPALDTETTFRDEDPPTVKLPPAPHPAPVLRRPALPVGTSDAPADQAWSASDQDVTWPASHFALLDDRTAPSLFPTPEDTGKERPFPPPPTPPHAPHRDRDRDVPMAITSTLLGMGVGLVFVLFLGAAVLGWVWIRDGL